MKCTKCGFILSPTEEDDILQGIAEGLKPECICEDCRDSYYDPIGEYDENEEDDDIL